MTLLSLKHWQVTMEVGGDRANRRELKDQMKIAVNAATQEGRDVRVPDMANGAELGQELLLPLLISRSAGQPLHCNCLPISQHSFVNLSVPTSANQVICSKTSQKDEILGHMGLDSKFVISMCTLMKAIGCLLYLFEGEASPAGLLRRLAVPSSSSSSSRLVFLKLSSSFSFESPANGDREQALQAPAPEREMVHSIKCPNALQLASNDRALNLLYYIFVFQMNCVL